MRKSSILILAFIVCVGLACGKQPQRIDTLKTQKVAVDSESDLYLDFIRAEIERFSENPASSLEAIDKVIARKPNVGYFYYQRALVNAGSGNWNEVIADCQEALTLDPKNLDAKIMLANAFGVSKQHEKAIKYLKEALKQAPEKQAIYPLLAKEYMNMDNRYKEAERVMLELLNRDTEAIVAYYYLGAIYGAYLKDTKRAINIYKKILDREPENFQVIDAISQLYLESSRPKEALEMLLRLEKRQPNDIALKLKIAQIYYKLKEREKAISRFEDILAKNPDSDKITYYLGILYEEVGRVEESQKMFAAVPPVSGLYKDARLRLAYGYKVRGDLPQAKAALLEAIRKAPKITDFYQYLGGIYEREGDLDSAIKLLQRATKEFPDKISLYYALGTLYEKKGDTKKAMESMRKVLSLEPENASALNYIGYTLVEQGRDMDEAEDMLQEAYRLKPEDGYIVDSLAWLYFTRGDFTRAFVLLKRANKLIPGEPTILGHLGQVYLERGEPKEAIKYFTKSLNAWQRKEDVNEKEIQKIISLIEKASNAN